MLAVVEAMVNQHGFKTFKGRYIVNYLHLWEILAEVELQPAKLFLFFFFLRKVVPFLLYIMQVQERENITRNSVNPYT